jgi:hypothetical protein
MEKGHNNLTVILANAEAENQEDGKDLQATAASTEVSQEEKKELSRAAHQSSDFEQRKGKEVSKTYLINKLNFTNFQEKTILINFEHIKYDRSITLHAKSLPCHGDKLDCLWVEADGVQQYLKSYKFKSFFITDGQKLLMVEPELINISKKSIRFNLPDLGYEVSSRKAMRHSCENIKVQLIQNSSLFIGTLVDFNAYSFRVKIKAVPPQTFKWINSDTPGNLIILDENEALYVGECRILKQTSGQRTREFVLEPTKSQIQRFAQKEHRSSRQEVIPSPNVVFKHPFINKTVSLKVVNMSGSGFSVEEVEHQSVLLPGMIIPDLELSLATGFNVHCKAQVVYRKTVDGGKDESRIKCGLAILDMDSEHHVKLLAFLQQAENGNSYVCNKLDLDALWDFFFETGFIYPEKYAFIEANKHQIKKTYEKLYTQNPNIARHFIYQENGQVLGHMAMIRYFENTWMIQHHAARKSPLNKAGLNVLNQIGNFTYDSYRLYSLHMDFLMCYYRPENKFPARVFGGAARHIDNPKGCSLDTFVYLHHQLTGTQIKELPGPWQLSEAQSEDFLELENFYEHTSGGLMLDALDLEKDALEGDPLSKEFRRLGFKRERRFYSLKKNDHLKAFIVVMISDIGLNLSNLTNCVKIFVLDSEDLSMDTFHSLLDGLFIKLGLSDMPVLFYPVSYAQEMLIPYEKRYKLWILSTPGHSDPYFGYIKRLLRFM